MAFLEIQFIIGNELAEYFHKRMPDLNKPGSCCWTIMEYFPDNLFQPTFLRVSFSLNIQQVNGC